jgi:hypothetical protein
MLYLAQIPNTTYIIRAKIWIFKAQFLHIFTKNAAQYTKKRKNAKMR